MEAAMSTDNIQDTEDLEVMHLARELREQGYDVDLTFRYGLEHGCRLAPRGVFNDPSRVVFISGPNMLRCLQIAAERKAPREAPPSLHDPTK
jgi:hypothetical protein